MDGAVASHHRCHAVNVPSICEGSGKHESPKSTYGTTGSEYTVRGVQARFDALDQSLSRNGSNNWLLLLNNPGTGVYGSPGGMWAIFTLIWDELNPQDLRVLHYVYTFGRRG